jgi:hypothetical protein
MAYVVNVQPNFNNAVKVVSNDAMDGTILSNNLTPEVLLNIWNTYPEMRAYLFLQWVNIIGSYPPGTIDASLLHAYDSSEVSHNPAKKDYPINTVGKHLNEARSVIDNNISSFIRSAFPPTILMDFSNSKFLDPRNTFTRNSIGSYIDEQGLYRLAGNNKPRFTHSLETQTCHGLFLEPSRTNIYPNSEDISTYKSSYVTFDGYTQLAGFRAFKFTINNSMSASINTSVSLNPNTTYTYSYLSSIQSTSYQRIMKNGNVLSRIIYAVVELYSVGVYRHTLTFTTASDEIKGQFYVGLIDVLGASFVVAAMQLEIGSFASSYIPTTSITPVTRALDRLAIPISIPPTEFTLLLEVDIKQAATESTFIELRGPDTTGSNSVCILLNNIGRYSISMDIGGVTQYNVQASQKASKGILVYQVTGAKQSLYYNGELIISNIATIALPKNLSNIVVSTGTIGTYYLKKLAYWNIAIPENDCLLLSAGSDKVTKFDLGRSAFIRPEGILRTLGRQEFSIHGTGASESRNIRRPYDFTFEIVDSSGVTTLSAQPAASCTANTDNTLTLNAPVGKTLVYAITPVYDN